LERVPHQQGLSLKGETMNTYLNVSKIGQRYVLVSKSGKRLNLVFASLVQAIQWARGFKGYRVVAIVP
jgi:hypothetical protein